MEAWHWELGLFHPHCKAASFKLNSSENQFGPCSESRHHDMPPTLQPTSLVFRRLESERAKCISLQGQRQSSRIFIWTSERCQQLWGILEKSFKTIMWSEELTKASSEELNVSSPAEQSPAAVGDRPGNFWESSEWFWALGEGTYRNAKQMSVMG